MVGDYDVRHPLLARTQMIRAYNSTFLLLKEWRSLLFRITINEHCVYDFLSLLSSALTGGPVDLVPNLEGTTTLAESGIQLPVQRDVHALVADFGLLFVLQGLQPKDIDSYLAYRRTCEVDWDDGDCVWWLPYVRTKGGVLDIPAQEVTSKNTIASDVHVKR